jgi:hypothetical protein
LREPRAIVGRVALMTGLNESEVLSAPEPTTPVSKVASLFMMLS